MGLSQRIILYDLLITTLGGAEGGGRRGPTTAVLAVGSNLTMGPSTNRRFPYTFETGLNNHLDKYICLNSN